MQEEQDQENARKVGRRGLLRRAGTVAAGAAGAGVVGAVVANPAQAAVDGPLVIGQDNTGGTDTTSLTAGSAINPALQLNNATGPALAVQPTDVIESLDAPAGSIFVDSYGDYNAIGEVGGQKFTVMAYSPTWAMMPFPIKPVRWVDTRNTAGRAHLRPGSTFDSAGRLVPKNSSTVPDAIIDLSDLFFGGPGAVQANLTVVPSSGGYASLWDEGNWPETSSINFGTAAIANFTQTLIGGDQAIRVKVSKAAAVVLDIVGFVVVDPFWQLPTLMGQGARSAGGRRQKRIPPQAN